MKNSEIIKKFIDSNKEVIDSHINNLPTLLHLMMRELGLNQLDKKLTNTLTKTYEENKNSSTEILNQALRANINKIYEFQ